MNTSTRNLLFLLAAAPMGMSCKPPDDQADDDVDSTTGDGDGETTTGDGETTSSSTDDTDETTGDGDTTTGDTTDETTGDGDTTTGDGDTTTGESNAACESYSSLITRCYDADAGAMALQYCLDTVDYYGAVGIECVSAYEAFLVCLSELDCVEFSGGDPVCTDEQEALTIACAP